MDACTHFADAGTHTYVHTDSHAKRYSYRCILLAFKKRIQYYCTYLPSCTAYIYTRDSRRKYNRYGRKEREWGKSALEIVEDITNTEEKK